ncbi:hypothetical protein LguiA_008646 [Lonicera macranthoides]
MVEPRRISVHHALGGGPVADVLLWKKWYGSVIMLIASTALWILFERAGYNLLSFVSNVLLLLVVILFLWARSALILNRPLPPLPDLEVSEESILKVVNESRVWINHVLSIARDIAIGGDFKRFLQVAFGFWLISYIGSFCNFLTLFYAVVLLSLSVPLVYDKFQDRIDEKLHIAYKAIQIQYKKIDDIVLRKLPMLNKGKKTQ